MPGTDQTTTTEDSGGKRQHLLADGRASRGFIACEREAVEAPISVEALGLLLRIRNASQDRESDGHLDARDVDAVTAYCQLPKARVAKLLGELADARLIARPAGGGVTDLNYGAWNKTRDQRAEQREKWRGRKRKSREDEDEIPLGVTPTSQRDIPGNPTGVPPRVTADVTGLSPQVEVEVEVEAQVEAQVEVTTTPVVPFSSRVALAEPLSAPLPLPLPPEVAARVEAIRIGCEEVLAVRRLRAQERDLVLSWAQLRRGEALVPVDEILTVVRRKMLEPTPDGTLPANLAWCADDVAALARVAATDTLGAAGERLTANSQLARRIEAGLRQRRGGAPQ